MNACGRSRPMWNPKPCLNSSAIEENAVGLSLIGRGKTLLEDGIRCRAMDMLRNPEFRSFAGKASFEKKQGILWAAVGAASQIKNPAANFSSELSCLVQDEMQCAELSTKSVSGGEMVFGTLWPKQENCCGEYLSAAATNGQPCLAPLQERPKIVSREKVERSRRYSP